MRSLDVIHSVFVPQFSQKEDVVPGLVTQLHITPTRVGTFPLECTELCGLGHSLMRTQAIVMKPAAFDSWLKQLKGSSSSTSSAPPTTTSSSSSSSSSSSGSAGGLSVFNSSQCASCHTLSAAHATGTVGPNLDKLVTYAKQAKKPLAEFVQTSIVSPSAYVQPGYPDGVMPQNFGQTLTKQQLGALVTFLVQSARQTGKQ
jgi:cytochrome c oxidase subunit 2